MFLIGQKIGLFHLFLFCIPWKVDRFGYGIIRIFLKSGLHFDMPKRWNLNVVMKSLSFSENEGYLSDLFFRKGLNQSESKNLLLFPIQERGNDQKPISLAPPCIPKCEESSIPLEFARRLRVPVGHRLSGSSACPSSGQRWNLEFGKTPVPRPFRQIVPVPDIE
jgi:hypothetical protein